MDSYGRVLFYCWGTRGDVQPPLALALKLRELGKEVAMFVTPPADDIVRKEGIPCTVASENIVWMLDALAKCDPGDTSISGLWKIMGEMKTWKGADEYKAAIQADTKAGYQLALDFKPDVIVHAGFEYGVWASVGEALGVPVVRYDLQPNYPTSEIGFFKKENGTFPSFCLRLVYWMYNEFGISREQRPRAMELRELAGLSLSTHADGSKLQLPPDLPQLCAMSPSFLQQPSDWPEFKEMTGYWLMKSMTRFTPPPELAAFLEAGAPPVYIGFGSMKGNPDFCKKLSTMAITALAGSKLRGILLGGWAGLTAQTLDTSTETGKALAEYAAANVFELDSCPHDWLFPRCAAVVHHGGAGTVSAGLAAGRPTIVCALLCDQPWHGSLIAQKKLGLYAGRVGSVSGEQLGQMLTRMLADPEIQANCTAVGESISAEDGTGNAAKAIGRACAEFKYPWALKAK
jgi:sterol 3beta-glucosyltransferase